MKKQRVFELCRAAAMIAVIASLLASPVLAMPAEEPSLVAETTPPTSSEAPETSPDASPETEEDLMEDHSVALTAPEGLRAGETVTFTFWVKGDNVRALQGTVAYDPDVLTYVSGKVLLDDWMIRFSPEDGTIQYLGVSGAAQGIDGKSQFFSLTFAIASEAETGMGIPFTLSDAIVYDGESELAYTGADYTFVVDRPLSTECTLTALSVEGGNLSPAFSPDVFLYTLNLPYTVEQAKITAQPCDLARVEMGNCTLAVGENDVTVTVISESGLQKVYTVKITRAADPYYVPSSNNRVLALTLSEGLLFPAFSSEITEYSVYIVKGHAVTLTPVPAYKASAKAITIPGDVDDGLYTIVCNAENGEERVYTFHTILLDTPEELAEIEAQNAKKETVDQFTLGILIFAGITVFFLGFVLSYILFGVRKKKALPKKAAEEEKEEPKNE